MAPLCYLPMPTKTKKDLAVDKYIKDAAVFAKPILSHLRKVVREACPQAQEEIKWRQPFYTYNGKIVCGMGTFKAHCKFWIWNWPTISKSKTQKTKDAMKGLLHIYKVSDLPNVKLIQSLLKESLELRQPGAKPIKRKPLKKKPPVKTPSDLMLALKANPKALRNFQAFSESVKRHYVDWILEAKTEDTRERRIEKSIDAIAMGKTQHWK